MGYEATMQADILALLQLFRDRVPDPESLSWVKEIASNRDRWGLGHDVFDRVRRRNILAIEAEDRLRECQYSFEEACLKILYNESETFMPFDSCSPYWIIKNALIFARKLEIPLLDVVAVVAPDF